jgi:CheY-like chemotaxis protein
MAPAALESVHSGIRILVADDQRVNQLILEAFLRKEGHTVLVANNGAEAVEMHRTEHPDLVLMDIMMPELDGLEAARRIAANGGAMRTPLLFLTAINDQQTMIEGLGLGDDFIAKPIDLAILRAKLRAFIRVVQGQRMLREQQQHIERLIDDMRRESEVAAHVMERVLEHTEKPDPDYLQYRVQPSAMFSGDMVLARRTPGGRLHLLLADAVGHGLPAAINILPLFFPFDGMARKGCSLATVARELNRRVRDLLPIDRFIAATLVSIDFASNSFEIWNGGNPPALVLADDGAVIERIDSMQLALGLNDDNPALFEPRHVRCGSRQQLLLCSDGIWENPAFSAGGDAGAAIAALMAATAPRATHRRLVSRRARCRPVGRPFRRAGYRQDVCPAAGPCRLRRAQTRLVRVVSLQFGPEALRRTDAVASVLDMAGSLGLVDSFPRAADNTSRVVFECT